MGSACHCCSDTLGPVMARTQPWRIVGCPMYFTCTLPAFTEFHPRQHQTQHHPELIMLIKLGQHESCGSRQLCWACNVNLYISQPSPASKTSAMATSARLARSKHPKFAYMRPLGPRLLFNFRHVRACANFPLDCSLMLGLTARSDQ